MTVHDRTRLTSPAVLFYFFCNDRAIVNFWVYSVTLPFEQLLGRACAVLPFSVAELLYVLAAVTTVVLLALMARYLVRSRKKGRAAYRCALFVLDLALTVYAAFCVLWGANYYADDFCDKSGLTPQPVAYEDLLYVTRRFANALALASGQVERDEDGLFTADRQEILACADTVYDCLYDEFPFLDVPDQQPKGIFFSKIMSAMNFTGFYFPFTGESNVNMDSPAMLLASTCAHELAHQRGIAREKEANFVAYLVCMESDDDNIRYSAYLNMYEYIISALSKADKELYTQTVKNLDTDIRYELSAYSDFFDKYRDSKASTVSETINNTYLTIQGTEGTKSYGMVVDLFVAYLKQQQSGQ